MLKEVGWDEICLQKSSMHVATGPSISRRAVISFVTMTKFTAFYGGIFFFDSKLYDG
jgi:hypothetical protein